MILTAKMPSETGSGTEARRQSAASSAWGAHASIPPAPHVSLLGARRATLSLKLVCWESSVWRWVMSV